SPMLEQILLQAGPIIPSALTHPALLCSMPKEMINEVSTVLSGDALIADQDKDRMSEKALVFMGTAVGSHQI
ncbi:hypothetical protein N8139_03815, partial [Schleiferiaceae bacterium]|nr:hypothetical protein [Schleiferiaceae bacterium]